MTTGLGDYNSIFGAEAGLESGTSNTLFGYRSGFTSDGSNNIFIGKNCGAWLNNANGIQANSNVCIGDSAYSLYSFTIPGSYNTVLGAGASSAFDRNVVIGAFAGAGGGATGGGNCTIIGSNATVSVPSGWSLNSCTVIGAGASASGNGTSSLVNATTIGVGASVTTPNTVTLGNTAVTSWLLGSSGAQSGKAFIVGTTSSNGNGAYLTSGGVWTNASDRNKKENFQQLSEAEILSKINQLQVTRWNYKGLTEQHIGPVAQDFHRIFNVGSDDKTISTIDPAGIALAGIQGLYHKWQYAESKAKAQSVQIKDQQSEIDELRTQVQQQQKDLQLVLSKLHSLETAINQKETRKEDVVKSK